MLHGPRFDGGMLGSGMATVKKTMPVLAEQTTNQDGSITVRALSIADGQEIGVETAGKILGMGRDSI